MENKAQEKFVPVSDEYAKGFWDSTEQMIKAGYVNPVRCRECKWRHTYDNTEYCVCHRYKTLKHKDGYCDSGVPEEIKNDES